MSNETNLVIHPTAQYILFRDPTDFSSNAPADTAFDLGIPSSDRITAVDIDMTSLAASGGYRQSDKFDFGAIRAPFYRLDACLEFATQQVDGENVNMYLGGTGNSTAGDGNPAHLTGVDGDWTEADGLLAQLQYWGSLTLDADPGSLLTEFLSKGKVGILVPDARQGILVVGNLAADAFQSAMDNSYLLATPMTYGT